MEYYSKQHFSGPQSLTTTTRHLHPDGLRAPDSDTALVRIDMLIWDVGDGG